MAEGLPAAAMPANAPGTPAPAASASAAVPGQAAKASAAHSDTAADPMAGMFALLMNDTAAAEAAPTPPTAPDANAEGASDDGDPPAAAPDALLLVLAQVTPVAAPASSVDAAPPPAANQAMSGTASAPVTAGLAPTQDLRTASLVDQAATSTSTWGANGMPQFPVASAPQSDGQAAAPATAFAAADAAPPLAADAPTPAPQWLSPTHGATASTTPAPPPAVVMSQPVQQPVDAGAGYDDSFGTQVAWLAEQRIGEAQIRVSPEHLGTIDIRLQLDGTQVRAEFHSAQAEVRQTLEASLPRLRDLLGQHGLQLAHAGVGQGHKQREGTPFAQTPGTTSRNEGDAVPPPGFRRARGLLDVYA